MVNMSGERVAQGLGWFSIGLGIAQVVAPRQVARLIGTRGDTRDSLIMRFVGVREIGAGIGILLRNRPTGWLWARVAGDVMDLTLLGAALTSDRTEKERLSAATASVVGIVALDLWTGMRLSGSSSGSSLKDPDASEVRKSVTVNRPVEELYAYWRQLENLPRFMRHLEDVQTYGDGRSHWRAKAPMGRTVEWDAEVTDDQPNRRIAWRSLPGADVSSAGSVEFRPAPGGRGTEVSVQLRYDPPGGVLGTAVAKLFGEEPEQQVSDDLRIFKRVMETGENTQSEATVHGHAHPARPPERALQAA
jgi:uncharacterized membrane protein